MKLFIVYLIFYSYLSHANELKFTPDKWDFELVLGPQGQVMSKANNCDASNELISGLSSWKKKLGEETAEVIDCKCGKRELEKETYEFFKDLLYDEYHTYTLELRKKSYLNRRLNDTCYRDLTGVMPVKFSELAKRQLIKDLDNNPINNNIYHNNGINCFATAMEASGYLDTPRFVSQYEFSNFLKSPLCTKVEGKNYKPGDIISYHREAKRYEDQTELNGYPIHASVLVTENLVFEKKGGHKDFPYQLAPFGEGIEVTKGPVAIYRCKNKKELLDEAKNISDFKDILESVEQIENCYSNYYRAERGTSMMRKVFPFVRTNLEIVEALINEKRSSLIDSTKGSPKQGKELEHEYWMLLHARVTSMYQNLNYNLEFPNMHDYLSITNR
jgi:hypothetical protein